MRRIVIGIIFVFVLLAGGAVSAVAQSINDHKSRKAQLEKEIALIDSQLRSNAAESKDALFQLSLVQKKISNRKELVAENDAQIRMYSDKITETQRQINRLQARVDTLSAYYARLVRAAYKNRDAKIWYMYILASDDLGQAFRRYSYFKNLSSQMKDQAEKIRVAQAELESEKKQLQELKRETEKVRAERQKELDTLAKEEKQSAGVINQLKRNRKKYEAQLASKKRQVDALNKEIQRLVEAAMKPTDTSKKPQPIDYKLAESFAANKGKLPWPAEGPVVDKFGQHYHPVFTRLKLPFNNGINIALAKNTEVRAIFDGVVKQIVVMPGYNQCVLVQRGNYFSFYCKLKSTGVKAGDKIETGQKIGIVDTINGDTQLHLQIWKGQSPQNPELWLRKR